MLSISRTVVLIGCLSDKMFLQEVSPVLKQTWTMSSVLLFNVGCGMMTDKTLPILTPSMQTEEDTSRILVIESTAHYMHALGLLSSAILMHWCGRRTVYIAATFSAILAWFTIFLADNTLTFTIGRVLGDFSKGAGIILGAMVIGEYTCSSYRGTFLTLASGSLAFGKMTACFLGNLRIISIFALVLSILSFAIACTWSESTAWLCLKKNNEDYKKYFKDTSLSERHDLTKLVKKQIDEKIWKLTILETLKDVYKNLTGSNFIKPLVVIIFANILLEASGKHVFEIYGSQIFREISGNSVFNYDLLINATVTSSIIFSSVLFKILNSRTVIFLSGSLSVLVLTLISLILFLTSNNIISIDSLILILLIALYLVLINLGCTVAFLNWCGELFPLEYKSSGLLISGLLLYLNKSLCLKITPFLLAGLKLYGMFGLLSVVLTFTLLILYFIVPETKNKNLLEIEYYFQYGDFERDDEVCKDMISI